MLWRAKADPEEVGATGNDFLKNIRLLIASEVAVLRSNDIELRISIEQALAEFFSAFWTAAEEVVREFGGAGRKKFPHESRPINAVLKGGTLAVQAPDEGHAIGDEEIDAGCDSGECGIVPPHGDDVGIGKIDGVGAGLPGAGLEVRAEGLVIGAGEVGGEDSAGCGHAGKRFSRGGAENTEILEEGTGWRYAYALRGCGVI